MPSKSSSPSSLLSLFPSTPPKSLTTLTRLTSNPPRPSPSTRTVASSQSLAADAENSLTLSGSLLNGGTARRARATVALERGWFEARFRGKRGGGRVVLEDNAWGRSREGEGEARCLPLPCVRDVAMVPGGWRRWRDLLGEEDAIVLSGDSLTLKEVEVRCTDSGWIHAHSNCGQSRASNAQGQS